MLRVYLIADQGLAPAVARALEGLPRGAALVQLRDKSLGGAALLRLTRELLTVCRARGAPLLVNDRADVARAAGLSGVHLPEAGLAVADARALLGDGALVGKSCHDEAGVAQASREGADFCVFGPVWEVPGKGPARGLAALSEAARAAPLPVFALGGVGPENAAQAIAAGARGVACIRSVLGAVDPAAAAHALWQAVAP